MHQFIARQWQKRALWAWFFSPLSLAVCALTWLKRKGYQLGICQAARLNVPVIVVGNLTVGGTGKTPLVIYLCQLLIKNGYRPGIISRGYRLKNQPHQGQYREQYREQYLGLVTAQTAPSQVGDEAPLLAERTGCPVMIGSNRVRTARRLLAQTHCDLIISDDGFQHLKLHRDLDLIVRDTQRGYGNGWCLPSGPLREPHCAQKAADFVVHNGGDAPEPKSPEPKAAAESPESKPTATPQRHYAMTLNPANPVTLNRKQQTTFANLSNATVHAVAAIGNPERFFLMLERLGLNIIRHPFRDHHAFSAEDLAFGDDKALLMTEKDAVKCAKLALSVTLWVVPVSAQLSREFDQAIINKLNQLRTLTAIN